MLINFTLDNDKCVKNTMQKDKQIILYNDIRDFKVRSQCTLSEYN